MHIYIQTLMACIYMHTCAGSLFHKRVLLSLFESYSLPLLLKRARIVF